MTKEHEQAIQILQKEYLCVDRDCDIERSCGKCDLMMPSKEPILKAYKVAIQAIKDLDKMNDIALDLAAENDDLIEILGVIKAETDILDKIRAEIQSEVDKFTGRRDMDDYECGLYYGHSCDIDIIDKYRKESEI